MNNYTSNTIESAKNTLEMITEKIYGYGEYRPVNPVIAMTDNTVYIGSNLHCHEFTLDIDSAENWAYALEIGEPIENETAIAFIELIKEEINE